MVASAELLVAKSPHSSRRFARKMWRLPKSDRRGNVSCKFCWTSVFLADHTFAPCGKSTTQATGQSPTRQ